MKLASAVPLSDLQDQISGLPNEEVSVVIIVKISFLYLLCCVKKHLNYLFSLKSDLINLNLNGMQIEENHIVQ